MTKFTFFLLIALVLLAAIAVSYVPLAEAEPFTTYTTYTNYTNYTTTTHQYSMLWVEPSKLNFGDVAVNTSKQLNFKVTNKGRISLIVKPVSPPLPFSAVPTNSFTLKPGYSKYVTVNFRPTSAGNFVGAVTFQCASGSAKGLVSGNGTKKDKESSDINVKAGCRCIPYYYNGKFDGTYTVEVHGTISGPVNTEINGGIEGFTCAGWSKGMFSWIYIRTSQKQPSPANWQVTWPSRLEPGQHIPYQVQVTLNNKTYKLPYPPLDINCGAVPCR
jgi:hypothetical protein